VTTLILGQWLPHNRFMRILSSTRCRSKSLNIIHKFRLFQVFLAKLVWCLRNASESIATVADLAIIHLAFFGVVIWIKVLALIDNTLFMHKFWEIKIAVLFADFCTLTCTTSDWFYHVLIKDAWSETMIAKSSTGSVVWSVHITTWTKWHHETLDMSLVNTSIFIHLFE